MTLQIIRDWVLRSNEAGIPGLATRKAPGSAAILDDRHRRALEEVIATGPIPAVHGVVRWRIIDLAQWLWDEFALSISKQTLGHELRTMGYRKLSARPRHRGQRPDDIAVFKKSLPPVWRKSGSGSLAGRRYSCGGRTRPASANRPSSPDAGQSAAPALLLQGTRTVPWPGSSGPSALLKARPPASSCPIATARPWACIWRKSPSTLLRERRPWSCSIRLAGTDRPN